MKRPVLVAAALLSLAGWGFDEPKDQKGDLEARFIGLDEDWSGKDQKLASLRANAEQTIRLELSNHGAKAASGHLTVSMPSDWQVSGPVRERLTLAPGETKTVTRTVRGTDRALNAIYPIHARFIASDGTEVHPIAMVRATDGARAVATPACVPPGERGADPATGAVGTVERFSLNVRGENLTAELRLGTQGVFNGTLTFAVGDRALALSGFICEVDGFAVGSGENPVRVADVKVRREKDRFEVIHRLAEADGRRPPVLRATFAVVGGALRVVWDMPGTVRTPAGTPRYTKLSPGGASEAVERAYASHGNVLSRPKKFRIRSNGFALSTRHVGADYANGLSLVQATDIVPDFWVCDDAKNLCGLEAHHDVAFFLVPSAKGAFAAARAFADVCGYRRSPGFNRLNGRLCLDQWGGDYGVAASDLRAAAQYGLTNAVFVKHDWQRWGYDFRLPDVYPPAGSREDFLKMRRAAEEAGILFVVHDNFTDFYPDADDFTFDAVRFHDDGTPITAWYHPGRRAQSYGWLPHAIQPWVKRNGRLLRDGFHPDGVFIDVLTAEAPFDYRDREGLFFPKTVNTAAWCDAFANYRTALARPDGVTISETGTDALVGSVDAAEADHPGADRWMDDGSYEDWERVPWHDMVTHGRMILQAGGLGWRYAADRNGERAELTATHGYASDDYLGMTLLGGRAMMSDGPFNRRAVLTDWMIGAVSRTLANETLESVELAGGIHRVHSTFSNGCEVWQNRDPKSDWTVGGHVLPPWGFFAKTPTATACAILRGGRRVGFARSGDTYFVDARPKHGDGRLKAVAVAAQKAEVRGPRDFDLTIDWRIFQPVARGYTFVHVVPENGGEGPILTQPLTGVDPRQLETCGGFSSVAHVHVPDDLPEGRYDLRAGVGGGSGGRLSVLGVADGQMRVKLGTMTVVRKGGEFKSVAWEPPAEESKSRAERVTADFGKVSTDGAFRLARQGRAWRVTPLPGSNPFSASIALSLLGHPQAKSVSVTPVDPQPGAACPLARIGGDRLLLNLEADAFAYDIVLK